MVAKKKNLIENVVKCSIKSVWACSDHDRDVLLEYIEKLVFAVSQRTYNASVALNYMLCEHFQYKNIEDVMIPEVDDQTFIRQMILGTKSAVKPFSSIAMFYKRHPNFLPNPPRFHSDRNIYTHAAIKYKTNLVNHVFMNFEAFQRRYHTALVKAMDWGHEDRLALLCGTNGWKVNYAGMYPMRSDLQPLIAYHRRILGCIEESEFLNEYWYKTNISSCLKYFGLMLRFLETQPSVKVFTLVPVCQMKRHFITLDRTTIESILKHLFPKYATHDLERWIDVNAYQGKRMMFSGTLDTDGISVCIHFTRPKIDGVSATQSTIHRTIAIDPGRTNIYTITEQQEDDSFTKKRFTRKQYRHDSGIVFADKKTKKWIEPFANIWNDCTPKVIDLALFQNYYDRVKDNYDLVWSEKLRRRWGQQSFRIYGGKKRAFANFWKQYQDNRNVLVLYGSAKFASTGRGEVAVPVSRAFKEVKDRFQVEVVDEFRTTRIHHECQQPLEHVKVFNQEKPLHGLHWCSSTKCCKFVDRDLNAAINIYHCGTLPIRPAMLCRTCPALGRMRIGRTIQR